MKKQILALAALCAGIAASAAGFSVSERVKLNPVPNPDFTEAVEAPSFTAPFTAPAKAEGETSEVYYTLAGEPTTAFGLQQQAPGMQLAMAFQFEPAFISGLTDGKITGITYYTGCEGNDITLNKITKAYVFITDNLQATQFLYTQEVEAPATGFTRVDVTLDTPFDIPADTKKLYCGVYFNFNSENNIPIVVDYMGHANDLGGWYAVRSSATSRWTWNNASYDLGFMTLGATVSAQGMPENCVSLVALDGQPVTYEKQAFPFQFLLENKGVNDVNQITVEFGVDTEELLTQTFTLNQPLPFNQMLIGTIDQYAPQNPTKGANVKFAVKEVNGVANASEEASGSYPIVVVPEGKGLPRNVVIEEFTSTSCVYCPVGYTAMEAIHEECTDGTIIPVCIHVNYPGTDPMRAASYNSVYTNYCSDGVPSTTINRTYSQYPIFEDLMELATELKALPAIAAVDAEATLDPETRKLTVDSKTSFSFDYTDGAANFILAYGVTEDNVGPYTQQNGYAGYSSAVPGDWQAQPATVKLMYNDVARQLDKYIGVTGSIPAEITSGEEYAFTHSLSVVQAATDLEQVKVVVYLMNRNTGAIENACLVKPVLDQAGIEDVVVDDSNAPVEYFNLQGIRVTEPAAGLYIRRQGDKATKVLVK